jgi:transcriptional regulator with XRE-family HTH domain
MNTMLATNNLAANGAGRWRRPYVIREHLAELGMTMEDVARQLDVSGELVRATIRGRTNNHRVLRKLLELGTPEDALSLPDDFNRHGVM